MIDQSTRKGQIVAATLKLAAERPWREITLRDIGEAAGVTLVDLSREFATKSRILVAFNRAIDEDVLRRAPKPTPGQMPRDAVFEVVMARFDALAPYRTAVKSIIAEASADGALLRSLLASQHWMLQAAGVQTEGLRGAIRTAGLASVYAGTFRAWIEDDDPGLARTMAVLDRRLRNGERSLNTLDDVCGGIRRMTSMVCDLRRKRSTSGPAASDGAPPSSPAAPVAPLGESI